jgi:hypothetical protein
MIFRIFIVLIVALAVGLYFPGSRAVIVEYSSPIVNPYLRMQTESEMQDIADELKSYQRENFEQLPTERVFEDWMAPRFPDNGSLDGWGNPYEYRLERTRLVLVSWGPDGERDSADDIYVDRPIR